MIELWSKMRRMITPEKIYRIIILSWDRIFSIVYYKINGLGAPTKLKIKEWLWVPSVDRLFSFFTLKDKQTKIHEWKCRQPSGLFHWQFKVTLLVFEDLLLVLLYFWGINSRKHWVFLFSWVASPNPTFGRGIRWLHAMASQVFKKK
jgi:hypothetical protein